MLSLDLCIRNITLFSLGANVVLSITSANELQKADNVNSETALNYKSS